MSSLRREFLLLQVSQRCITSVRCSATTNNHVRFTALRWHRLYATVLELLADCLTSGYPQLSVCVHVCVSVSTRVHAGLGLGPDCLLSARRCSSGRGPRRNASARTDPTRLCGEGRPVGREDTWGFEQMDSQWKELLDLRSWMLMFFWTANITADNDSLSSHLENGLPCCA